MKKIRNFGRKTLSMLLTLVMLFSMLQLTAFAAVDNSAATVAEEAGISKTAEGLYEENGELYADVTLSVPGKQQDYSSDIVMIIGRGPSSDYDYVIETIKKMLIAADGTSTKIKLGLVTFADTTELETVLPLTVMKDVDTSDADPATQPEDDMDRIIYDACQKTYTNYSGINLESSLITARDMLEADTSVPAHRKHLIVVSTGLTYWFDNDEGEPVTVIGTNKFGNYMHGNKYWLQARDASTNTSAGYYMKGWMLVNGENGQPDYQASWNRYWDMIEGWIDADQDAYVYNPEKTYSEFYYNGNSTEIRPQNNANYRYGSAIQNEEDLAKVTGAVPYFAGGANPATTPNAAHALNYERAQYEAWVVYNEMATKEGKTFKTVLKDAKGEYITVEGLGYNCYAVANGVSSNPGDEDRWLESNQIGYNFMRMLGGDRCVNWRDHNDFFEPIENEILYYTGIGSYVEDEIGYDAAEGTGYDFDFVNEAEALTMKVGVINYTAAAIEAENGATTTYAFTAEGADEATFWLDYYGEDPDSENPEAESFKWRFGENISRFAPASLTYKLKLAVAPTVPGEYDLDTNEIAELFPKDRTPEEFPKPDVPYEVLPNILTIEKNISGLLGNDTMPETTEFTVTGDNGFTQTYTYADFEDGVLTIENLPAGTYTISENEESAAVENYTLTVTGNGAEAVFAESFGGTAAVEISNDYAPITGTLQITKTVSGLLSGDEMAATFTVTGPYDYNETFEYAEFENGILTIENLPIGEYTVVESGAEKANYDLVVTNAENTAVIEQDATAEVAIANDYTAHLGSVTVTKTVAGDNVMPEDASFLLKKGEKVIASADWTDFVDGTYTFENIPVGEYTLVEDGVSVETHALSVNTVVNGEETNVVAIVKDETAAAEITNTYTEYKNGTLIITKVFTGVEALDPAISFTVTGPDGFEETFTYGDFTDGKYTITDLQAGTYTVTEDEESAQIEEYQLNIRNNGAEVEVSPIGRHSVIINNVYTKESGNLTVTKTVAGLEEDAVMAPETLFEVKDASGATVASATWAEFENGSYTFTDLPIGEYTVVETGAEVEGYEGPATVIIYDGSENNDSAEIVISETAAADITNTYKKIETDFYYDVIHAFYYSENGGEYEYVGEGEPVRHGPVQVAPTNAQVFNAEDKSDDFDGDTYDRLDEYATGEVTVTGSLEGKDLVYTVKYYLSDWTKGSLTITKTIKGLDEKAERTLKANLKFRVTGPDGYDETFSYIDDFSSKGKLTIKNLVPGTYSVEEIGADIGGGYELYVTSDEEVEVKGSAKATNFRITNEYTSRVYNVWFDGGAHGTVMNPNGKVVNGVWRSHWHNYETGTSQLSSDDYDWAASQLKTGTPIYKYGSTNLYPNLVENPEVEEDTHMVMYTITWAQWNEHSKKMGISAPDLDTDDGWKTNAKYYVVGADEEIPFTTMADAIEYMNEEVEPDANGFYNVLFMPEYKRDVPMGGDDDDRDPIIPVIPDDPTEIPDEDVPTTEIPDEETPKSDIPEEGEDLTELEEEEVPLVELPDMEVPKTGDDMMMYMFMAAASAIGLVALAVTGKKREEEIAE